MRPSIPILAALLAACTPVAQPVYTGVGRQGVALNCTFDTERLGAGNWGICYQKAGELCGAAGYDVLQKSDDVSTHSSWGMYGGSIDTINQRTMIVACNGGASAQAQAGGGAR